MFPGLFLSLRSHKRVQGRGEEAVSTADISVQLHPTLAGSQLIARNFFSHRLHPPHRPHSLAVCREFPVSFIDLQVRRRRRHRRVPTENCRKLVNFVFFSLLIFKRNDRNLRGFLNF